MSDPALDLDRRMRAPLADLEGAEPAAPDWFKAAIAQAPEQTFVDVQGAAIEVLTWGERGAPGLLLVHGGAANAHWWAHIAPQLARDHRVAALSLSGNGGSDWRERYEVAQCGREMLAAARAAGLYDNGQPVFAAHSFGSRPLLNVCADPEHAPRAAVIVDAAVSAPDRPEIRLAPPHLHKVYPTVEAALARYRLMPPQLCDNLFILDYIARHSMKPVVTPEGGRGWSWRFDPCFLGHVEGSERPLADAALRAIACPLAVIYGDRSAIVRPDNLAYTRSIAPKGLRAVAVENAAHHLFLDQPLAFVDRLRQLLSEFP